MSAGRKHEGCWTCRLRHKKCDEAKPSCNACAQRELPCHGYGPKPTWFDGHDAERAELARVKSAVKRSLRRKSRGRPNLRQQPSTEQQSESTSPAELTSNIADPSPALTGPRKSSLGHLGERITSYREAELLMHYIDHVFPLQFRFYTGELRDTSRSWLFWLLISTGPLYHAALSLSALHQYKLLEGSDDVATELSSYHPRALNDLHAFVGDIGERGNLENINEQIQILSCGVSLISFELFRGGNNDWRPHLDALASLSAVQDPTTLILQTELEPWQRAALAFLIPVTTWFDLLASASTSAAPRVPYRKLFDTEFGDVESVMGCESWIVGVIGDLAHLSHWKTSQQEAGRLSVPELVAKSHMAEQLLNGAIDNHGISRTAIITQIFAHGCLVYLHVIVSGAYPALPEIQQSVEATLTAIEAVEDCQMIRGLIWPLCLAACLATAGLRQRFRDIIHQVISASGDFGNSKSISRIAETCWSLQDADPYSAVDWRQAMAALGTYVLLV